MMGVLQMSQRRPLSRLTLSTRLYPEGQHFPHHTLLVSQKHNAHTRIEKIRSQEDRRDVIVVYCREESISLLLDSVCS